MKTRLSLFFLSFGLWFLSFGNASAQQRGRGEIAVQSEDGEKLGIEVDGRRYDRFSTELLLGNIPSGRRSVIVYRMKPHNRDGGATAQTVYEGQLLVRAGYRILLSVNPKSGTVSIQHQSLTSAPVVRKEVTPQPSAVPETAAVPETPAATAPRQIAEPVNAANGWEEQVAAKNTDTEKLRILRARVTGHTTTTASLLQMMAALSFEDSRLELARAALPNLSDPENTGTVAAAFENPESRKSFEESARRQR